MKIILLTRDNYEHCYVANKLASAHQLSAIIVDQGKAQKQFGRVRKMVHRYSPAQLLSRFVGKIISVLRRDKNYRRWEMFRILGRKNCESHLHPEIITYVHSINTEAGVDTIRKIQPDVILVYGTEVISDKILRLARMGVLNMHTGISPYYRGAGSAFWPLYNGEIDMLGATIHQCTSEIDGGLIYEAAQADLQADDGLFAVFARCVKVGTELYIKAVGDLLEGQLVGTQQQLELGREYRAARKGGRKEWIVRRKIRKGLIRDYVRGKGEFV